MAPEHNLPPNFHLACFLFFLILQREPSVFKSTTSTSYRNLKTKSPSTCLPPSPFFPSLSMSRLVPQSRGSLKVNPRQELSLPPMLVRKSALEEKKAISASAPPPKKKPTTNQRRGCGVSFSLSSIIFFPLSVFFLSRCVLVACVLQKGNCPSLLLLLLLLSWCSHSPPPIFRSPFER